MIKCKEDASDQYLVKYWSEAESFYKHRRTGETCSQKCPRRLDQHRVGFPFLF